MRGKLAVCVADAGCEDHPRGCGENYTWDERGMGLLGSPPRMRGKPEGEMFDAAIVRITPADAGKTPR